MALYAYVKKKNKESIVSRLPSPRAYKAKIPQKTLFLISSTLFLAGLFLIGQVAYPILGWYLFVMPGYSSGIASPLSTTFENKSLPAYPAQVQAEEASGVTTPKSTDPSYNANTWFVGARSDRVNSELKVFNLSVPKIKIDSATVQIGGDDLKKSLVAWPTSAPPGSFGNTIVFGHSELPQFASPSNYSGIFTHLMDLDLGDSVLVDYDGIRYRYVVSDKTVVSPTDLSVLEQRFDSAYLTLITCVPPGTVWKRGVVKAKLSVF